MESYIDEPDALFAALDDGVADPPAGDTGIVAAGVWGRYGSVVAVRRDDDGGLLDDVYLLERSDDGRWKAPGSSSGSGLPEWVLDRPAAPLPDWRDGDLVVLGWQVAWLGGEWVAELTVMATRAVSSVEVRYGGESITVPVSPSGLVTLPGVIRSVTDVAEFRGYDDAGELRAVLHYRPLTEEDRKLGWPDDSLWPE